MLMTHTSSIRDWNSSSYIVVGDPTESLASIMENYLDIAGAYYSENHYWNLIPGSYLHYATAGTGQLGYLVEPLTGMEFKQYARDSLFDPLEMPNTAWFLSELNQGILASGYSYSGGNYTFIPHMGLACYPGFSLRSTALDLANLNIMLLNNGLFNDEQILTEAAVDSMMTVQGPGFSFWIGLAGLGMFKTDHFGDREVWGHYGGGGDYGFAGHFFLSPVEGTGVVVLSNSGQWLDELVEYLFDFAWLVITDIPEETKAEPIDITLYPNPASNNLNVRCTANIAELNIYSFSGQQISCSQGSPGIDISFLAPGIYIIEAKTVEGVVRRKFVKK
jgi:CubicO group peptidase (beta-lactamase class C family)